LESERVISNDWVVRHDNRYFQIQRQALCYAPAKGPRINNLYKLAVIVEEESSSSRHGRRQVLG
jgi:hypothetical protein